jgi:hypothetical protein
MDRVYIESNVFNYHKIGALHVCANVNQLINIIFEHNI